MLKWQAAEGGPLGEQIDFCVQSGKLVDDAIVIKVVRSWLQKQTFEKIVLLDGFPRTRAQAVALYELLQHEYQKVQLCLVLFDLPDIEIEQRMAARRVCSNHACGAVYSLAVDSLRPKNEKTCDRCGSQLFVRVDDTPEVVRERLAIYHREAESLIEFYTHAGLAVQQVTSTGPIESVYDGFVNAVQACWVHGKFC
jgi:adenylate kinase